MDITWRIGNHSIINLLFAVERKRRLRYNKCIITFAERGMPVSIKVRNRITAAVMLLAFFVIGSVANVTWNEPLSFTSTMVFSALAIMWTVSIASRVTKRREKRYFLLLGAFMLLWLVERAVKFSFFLTNEWVARHLWYGYYIPIIIMPLISLMLSLCLGKTDDERLDPKLKLLYVPALLLICGIMTNDFHQLAFRFNEGFSNWGSTYSYGALYYLVVVWIAVIIIASLVITVRFSTVSGSRKKAVSLLAVIAVSGLFAGIYVFTDFKSTRIMNVPELFCFCLAAYWEACLQTGLMPSNTGYDLLFKKSHNFAEISDDGGNVIYKTALEKGNNTYVEHEQKISGGKVKWLEDVTVVNRQKEQLEDANRRLSARAELQEKENALKEERMQLAEQQKIYDKMNASFEPQTKRIRTLVNDAEQSEEKWKNNMLWVCVIGAYIKRKSNLILLSTKSDYIPLSELGLAWRESLSYLAKAGVVCSASSLPDLALPSGLILYAYDEFETLLERKMPQITSVNLDVIEKEKSVLFDIKIDETPLMFEFDKGVTA